MTGAASLRTMNSHPGYGLLAVNSISDFIDNIVLELAIFETNCCCHCEKLLSGEKYECEDCFDIVLVCVLRCAS